MKPKTTKKPTKQPEKKSIYRPSAEIKEMINDNATLILNLSPIMETDTFEECVKKGQGHEELIKAFLDEFMHRVLPQNDGDIIFAIFEPGRMF